MKELRHIRRSRARWEARRAARAYWFKTLFYRGDQWSPAEIAKLESYTRHLHRAYTRQQLGLD